MLLVLRVECVRLGLGEGPVNPGEEAGRANGLFDLRMSNVMTSYKREDVNMSAACPITTRGRKTKMDVDETVAPAS